MSLARFCNRHLDADSTLSRINDGTDVEKIRTGLAMQRQEVPDVADVSTLALFLPPRVEHVDNVALLLLPINEHCQKSRILEARGDMLHWCGHIVDGHSEPRIVLCHDHRHSIDVHLKINARHVGEMLIRSNAHVRFLVELHYSRLVASDVSALPQSNCFVAVSQAASATLALRAGPLPSEAAAMTRHQKRK